MKLRITLMMIVFYLLYVLYLVLIKRRLRKYLYPLVYLGLLLVAIWGAIYLY